MQYYTIPKKTIFRFGLILKSLINYNSDENLIILYLYNLSKTDSQDEFKRSC